MGLMEERRKYLFLFSLFLSYWGSSLSPQRFKLVYLHENKAKTSSYLWSLTDNFMRNIFVDGHKMEDLRKYLAHINFYIANTG